MEISIIHILSITDITKLTMNGTQTERTNLSVSKTVASATRPSETPSTWRCMRRWLPEAAPKKSESTFSAKNTTPLPSASTRKSQWWRCVPTTRCTDSENKRSGTSERRPSTTRLTEERWQCRTSTKAEAFPTSSSRTGATALPSRWDQTATGATTDTTRSSTDTRTEATQWTSQTTSIRILSFVSLINKFEMQVSHNKLRLSAHWLLWIIARQLRFQSVCLAIVCYADRCFSAAVWPTVLDAASFNVCIGSRDELPIKLHRSFVLMRDRLCHSQYTSN